MRSMLLTNPTPSNQGNTMKPLHYLTAVAGSSYKISNRVNDTCRNKFIQGYTDECQVLVTIVLKNHTMVFIHWFTSYLCEEWGNHSAYGDNRQNTTRPVPNTSDLQLGGIVGRHMLSISHDVLGLKAVWKGSAP